MYQCSESGPPCTFLGLPNPHRDPLVRGTDPQLDPYQNVTDPQHWFSRVELLVGGGGGGLLMLMCDWDTLLTLLNPPEGTLWTICVCDKYLLDDSHLIFNRLGALPI